MLSPYTCVSCDQPLIQHDEHSFIHYCINPNCEEAKLHLSLLEEMGLWTLSLFLYNKDFVKFPIKLFILSLSLTPKNIQEPYKLTMTM